MKQATSKITNEKENKMNKSPAQIWRMEDSELKPIVSFYPLAKTHIVINGSTAPVLCGRICEFSRLNSLATKWNDVTPNSLRCSTEHFLVIEINLWKSNPTNGNSNSIAVEIRRLKGDALQFHKLKCLLFKSLVSTKGNCRHEKATPANYCTNADRRPLQLKFLGDALHSVSIACDLISKDTTQETISGMQILIFFTDPRSVHPVYAAHVSNMILTGFDPFGLKTDVRKLVYRHVVSNHDDAVHHCALQIIGNCLYTIRADSIFKDYELDLWGSIVPALLQDMEHVDHNPHIACNATRCFRGWISAKARGSDSAVDFSIDVDRCRMKNIIARMISYGKENHAKLERESMALLATIVT